MIFVSLIGLKKCGKTTTAEALIREFKRRGMIVGGVKFMPNSTITLDMEGKDTWRHRKAGADFVISLSRGELGYIGDIKGRAALKDALRIVPEGTDILICEGLNQDDPNIIKVLVAKDLPSIEETYKVRGISKGFIALTGIISNEITEHPEYMIVNPTREDDISTLANMIMAKATGEQHFEM